MDDGRGREVEREGQVEASRWRVELQVWREEDMLDVCAGRYICAQDADTKHGSHLPTNSLQLYSSIISS